jgi:hypothetical protein
MTPAAIDQDMPYRLDLLGWLQFERLCRLMVELECGTPGLAWRGRADRFCHTFVGEDELVLPDLGVCLRPPVTVAVVWVPAGPHAAERVERLGERIAGLIAELGPWAVTDEVLALTNLDPTEACRAGIMRSVAAKRVTLLGPVALGRCIDARAQLRAAMPSVLGVRDLVPLIDGQARARSSVDIEAAQKLARVFVPTRAYSRAREVLAAHRFVVLTGPPEMGKTAIARTVALAQLTDGWEAHECTRPEQVWRAFEQGRKQVFVADDAFGSTEYRPEAAELWARELGRMLIALDDSHWLIWTSRPAPLRAGLARVQRERGSERFPAPGEVLVDASALDLAEKTLILFRHAKDCGEGADAVRAVGLSIVEHPHFTPERIRRFACDHLRGLSVPPNLSSLLRVVENELSTPTDAMRTSFAALTDEHRAVLIALLDAPAGLVDERELAAAIRRHHPSGLSRPPDQLVDRLSDHFLHIGPLGIGWVHPSWRDLVIDELRADSRLRQHFLGCCGVHGAMLALSAEGGASGERALPLLLVDGDWDLLAATVGRLLRDLDDHDLTHLLIAGLGAASAQIEDRRVDELESLVEYALSAVRRQWDSQTRVLPVFLLQAWFELNRAIPEPLDPPQLASTWIELHPGVLDRTSGRIALAGADEWLSLVDTLATHAPASLTALGFPDREAITLQSLVYALSAADEESHELAERVLRRIRRLSPAVASSAHAAIRRLQGTDSEREEWWIPEDLPVPPSTEPASVRSTDFLRSDIDRVLADL